MDRIGLAILEQELKGDAAVMEEAARLAGVSGAFPTWIRSFCDTVRSALDD